MERDYIHLGDCFDMLADLPEGQIDAVITDPPYGLTQCEWDTAPDLERLFRELWRVLKPNGALLMFAQQPFATDCINASRKQFRYEWVWEKTQKQGFLNAKKMPLHNHELILAFYRKLPTYNPQFTEALPENRMKAKSHGECNRTKDGLWGNLMIKKTSGNKDRPNHVHISGPASETYVYIDTGKRYPSDILKFSNWNGNGCVSRKGMEKKIHPTQKPLLLLEYLIKTYTNEGETVLDPFMGGATTAVAALRTGRHYIGAEFIPDYHAKALARIERHRQQLATAEEDAPQP